MSLPKNNRLSLRQNRDLFSVGQKFYSKHFTIVKCATPRSLGEVGQPVFSILVSKKTAKKAHDRNKIRRLTISAIQSFLPRFPVGQYLVIPKSTTLITPFSDLLSDLSTVLPKLKQ